MSDKDAGKKWIIGLLCLIAVGISVWSIWRQIPVPTPPGNPNGPKGAGYPGGGRPQVPGARGRITQVSAHAITVQGRGGGPQTFTLTAATKITVDRAPAAAAALKAGERAFVVSPDKKTATEVHIRTGAGRPGGGPPGGGRPGGPPRGP